MWEVFIAFNTLVLLGAGLVWSSTVLGRVWRWVA